MIKKKKKYKWSVLNASKLITCGQPEQREVTCYQINIESDDYESTSSKHKNQVRQVII